MHGLGSEVRFLLSNQEGVQKDGEAGNSADASKQNRSREWNGKGTGPIPGTINGLKMGGLSGIQEPTDKKG